MTTEKTDSNTETRPADSVGQVVGWQFHPLPDITAFEAAQCINTALGGGDYNALPSECQRHFRKHYAPKKRWWQIW